MNVNCYCIMYFSVISYNVMNMRNFICRHFSIMQYAVKPILSQSLVAHQLVKQENYSTNIYKIYQKQTKQKM